MINDAERGNAVPPSLLFLFFPLSLFVAPL